MEILLLALLVGGLLLASGKKQRVLMTIGDKNFPVSAGDVVSMLFLVEPGMTEPTGRADVEASYGAMAVGTATINSVEWRPDGSAYLLVLTYTRDTNVKVGSSMVAGKYRITLSDAQKAPIS